MTVQEVNDQLELLMPLKMRPEVPEFLTREQAAMIMHKVDVCWQAQRDERRYCAETIDAAREAIIILQRWAKAGPIWNVTTLASRAQLFADLESAARDAVNMGRLTPLMPALAAISGARTNTVLGVDYRTKAELDAAIDESMEASK